MKHADYILVISLIVTNLAAGLGLAIPIAGMLQKNIGRQNKTLRYVSLLVGVYFLECVAFTFGMCTQIFTFGLAIVWGIVLGLWWQGRTELQKGVKTAILFSLYGCVPTLSFVFLLLLIWAIADQGLLNVEQAENFGIPQFVPWPFNTMLGFCAGLAAGTILIKTLITTGIVKWLISRPAKFRNDLQLNKEFLSQ